MTVSSLRASLVGLSVAAAVALVGCSTVEKLTGAREKPVEANLYPSNYRAQIAKVVSTLVDPATIRNAQVAQPVLRPEGDVERYETCVRFTAGGEEQERFANFFAGDLNQFVKAQPGQCSFAAYQPFPELERLCPGGKCS